MLKNILGLDLGTTSIGWAHVVEDDSFKESYIRDIGVRVVPLSTDEQTNFEKGKAASPNADRTNKRSARRNLSRYKLRRENLREILIAEKWVTIDTPLAETGKRSTFETLKLRTKGVSEKITKEEFARVLFSINKKRGYKSSRKAKNDDEGQIIDGMSIAKKLYEENLTPGQFVYGLLLNGKKAIPEFYRSDLELELEKVWNYQTKFLPDILTNVFKKNIEGKGLRATAASFWGTYQFNTEEIKGTKDEKKLQVYRWRSIAINTPLKKEEVAYVIAEINGNINQSSGYLGSISDRSKELYFTKQTVGQYLYNQIKNNPHTRLKGQVFYRQDYLDEFEILWETQAKYHPELNPTLKENIRDVIIFYQRRLKSQKGLVNYCQFESKEIEFDKNGKKIKMTVGSKVCPKSSPIFQEFKSWQILGHMKLKNKLTQEVFSLDDDSKKNLFNELNLKGNISASKIIEILGYKSKDWEINYSTIEGNHTNKKFYTAFLQILELEGYDIKELLKLSKNTDEISLTDLDVPATEIKKMVKDVFSILGINTQILDFNAEIEGELFELQPAYQFWHLLYSAEDDTQKYTAEDIYLFGNHDIHLKKLLCKKFGFKPEHTKILSKISIPTEYGSLSTKAIRKIYPFIKELQFDKACFEAGYKHSNSLTKEENEKRELSTRLDLLKKNRLRNPVVEKILNQMINVTNELIKQNSVIDANGSTLKHFYFDEIRIELARELKKNAKERTLLSSNIEATKRKHEIILNILIKEFNIPNPTRNDIIRYKLYQELKNNGYRDLYTNTYIQREILFSKEIDIEHIIPKARIFDDSFSNKTLAFRQTNLNKREDTAFDFISKNYNAQLADYTDRINHLFDLGKKNPEEGISKAKYKKLLLKGSEIGDGFIERDIRETQYIAKKAKQLLETICRNVISTTGEVTDRLREDWGLINVMKELNLPKYKTLGLTKLEERKYGQKVEVIESWNKRNDHRHHAMDALTVAFTKHSYIQYLNNLNARKDEFHKKNTIIIAIENKETILSIDENGDKKRKFREPIQNFRQIAKERLESVLISHKVKNKVATKNKNYIKGKHNPQDVLTPRGQLHKETVYGKYHYYTQKEEKIGAKLDQNIITRIINPTYRNALIKRLEDYGNDPKKAFGGKNAISKTPVKTISGEIVPEKVKISYLENDFSIRKIVNPDNFPDKKSIEKIIDKGIKTILLNRLEEHKENSKTAFSDLDKSPIWLNKEKGIAIKKVAISGVKNAEPLHYKKDHLGNLILDEFKKRIPTDYISTGNNHHVSIYEDSNGFLQEYVVSLYEAVARVNQGLPIVDKNYNQAIGWRFLFTLKQNEMFVFPNKTIGFDPDEINLFDAKNRNIISPNLFRVQTISVVKYGNSTIRDFKFRHHLETTLEDRKELQGITYHQIKSLEPLRSLVKVRLNHLGQITWIGEY
ncbi:MAG: hypothetical protein RL596_1611 [Bacteroidota bacterium]|jgi:CRISPR-associated endonuclease Csn1